MNRHTDSQFGIIKKMSEKALVLDILKSEIEFPKTDASKMKCLTEVPITFNRVDVVYFEINGSSEAENIIAVEAKLRDWRRALRQAYRNKLFATRTYVAMPRAFSASALSNLAEFRIASVGLMTVEGTNVDVHYHPPANEDYSETHLRLVRRYIARAL